MRLPGKAKFCHFPLILLSIQDYSLSLLAHRDGARDTNLVNEAVGTWMCTQSTDSQAGYSFDGLMFGREVSIKRDGTFTSTAPSFGASGTYSISGNQITAKSSAGTFVVTVTISGNKMTWNGTASNGVTFHYVFQREV